MANILSLTFKMEDPDGKSKDRLGLAVRHDFLITHEQPSGMSAENFSEWVRWLINRRLSEIMATRVG